MVNGTRRSRFEILERGVDADVVAKFGIAAPNQNVRIGKLRKLAERVRIEVGVGGDAQILQNLEKAVGGNGMEAGRLANVGAENIGEAAANPVDGRIGRSVAKRQDRERKGWAAPAEVPEGRRVNLSWKP